VEGDLIRLTVDGDNGRLVDVDRATGCADANLPAGDYRIGAWHDGAAMTSGSRVAFVGAPLRLPRLTICPDDADGDYTKCTPKDGYFILMQAGSCGDGQGHNSLCNRKLLRVLVENSSDCNPGRDDGVWPIALTDSLAVDEYSLFLFDGPTLSPTDRSVGPRILPNIQLGIDPTQCAESSFQVPNPTWEFFGGNVLDTSKNLLFSTTPFPFDHTGLFISDISGIDGGSPQYQGALFGEGRTQFSFAEDEYGQLRARQPLGSGGFVIPFRYLPDGTALHPLDPGEVALFQGCNYTGKANVFVADTPAFSDFSTAEISLDGTTRSVKLGPNTAALLYPSPNFKGTPVTVSADTPCLQAPVGSSLQVRTNSSILVTTRSCVGCDLTGADLRGADLSNVTLTGARLDNALLQKAVLRGARLDNASMSPAYLQGANLSNANLANADLSGSFLDADPGNGITATATLRGAYLRNVNLKNAHMAGADFSHADFFGDTAAAGAPCTVGKNNFTNGCATAAGATVSGADFSQAYLFGVDFGGATIDGVKFGNAVLIGSSFTGASLTSSIGSSDEGFSYAHLQGADLSGTKTLQGVTFAGAYVDFRGQGNDAYLDLDGSHTNYPGRPSPGQKVCVLAAYLLPSKLPPGNTTITCPNGTPASEATPPGCGPATAQNTLWASTTPIDQTTPAASYTFDATYTKAAATPICSDPVIAP
jgi:uncharacterized protein YjbI with pentapeptide repeats